MKARINRKKKKMFDEAKGPSDCRSSAKRWAASTRFEFSEGRRPSPGAHRTSWRFDAGFDAATGPGAKARAGQFGQHMPGPADLAAPLMSSRPVRQAKVAAQSDVRLGPAEGRVHGAIRSAKTSLIHAGRLPVFVETGADAVQQHKQCRRDSSVPFADMRPKSRISSDMVGPCRLTGSEAGKVIDLK